MGSKILNFLFSTQLMLVLLVLFPIAMGLGTFLESWYSTDAARIWVYNAWWFELLMVFMAINFFGNIFKVRNNFQKGFGQVITESTD